MDVAKTIRWIKNTASRYQKKTGDINYLFCSDKRILEVNNQFLHHDYYTDIITFDYSEHNRIAGDIFISIDTVRSNAETFETPFTEELNRVIIHGILHLCGYADKTAEEAKNMRLMEYEALLQWNLL
ncbi:MAG: rRNA maturation RNase YbeY [Prevotellaceae bacterium]|nr:rRNA maturation RNase YbeY [Prevotellaceae bacterium]